MEQQGTLNYCRQNLLMKLLTRQALPGLALFINDVALECMHPCIHEYISISICINVGGLLVTYPLYRRQVTDPCNFLIDP